MPVYAPLSLALLTVGSKYFPKHVDILLESPGMLYIKLNTYIVKRAGKPPKPNINNKAPKKHQPIPLIRKAPLKYTPAS
jgi:hypothetical protein